MEGGVHRCHPNVIKCTRAPGGKERERERETGRGREAREGGRRALSQVKCKHVRLTTARSSNSLIQAMLLLPGPRDFIHEYRL